MRHVKLGSVTQNNLLKDVMTTDVWFCLPNFELGQLHLTYDNFPTFDNVLLIRVSGPYFTKRLTLLTYK